MDINNTYNSKKKSEIQFKGSYKCQYFNMH